MSPIVRIFCGVLGISGIAAIAFNAYNDGGIEPDFILFGSLFGGFVFLYAALFGSLPWGTSDERDGDKGEMTRFKWQMFWAVFVTFLLIASYFLAKKGVFEEYSLMVISFVGILFAIVGIAIYLFVKDRPDDLH